MPLAYLPGGATRIRVKAVGDLDLGRLGRDRPAPDRHDSDQPGTQRHDGATPHA